MRYIRQRNIKIMIITKITIDEYGEINHHEIPLKSGINIIDSNYREDVLSALCRTLSYQNRYTKNRNALNKKNTSINIKIDNYENDFDKSQVAKLCQEYMQCRNLDMSVEDDIAGKIKQYYTNLDTDFIMEFSKKTNGLGTTKSFRAYIRKFIDEFKPVSIGSGLWIDIDKYGGFILKGLERNRNNINEKDNAKFKIGCFMQLNRFWDGAMEMHGPNTPSMPMMISGVKEELLNCINWTESDVNNNERQVLVFTT